MKKQRKFWLCGHRDRTNRGVLTLAGGAAIAMACLVAAQAQERTRCDGEAADSCQWGNLEARNLDGKDLSQSNYMAIHMRGATMRGATLEMINLQVADLSGSDLSGANLTRATLFAANAEKANFAGANLAGANLTRANLAGANLKDARIDAMTLFIATRLGGATWIDGRVCAPGSVGRCD